MEPEPEPEPNRPPSPPTIPKLLREETDLTLQDSSWSSSGNQEQSSSSVTLIKSCGRLRLLQQRQFKNSLLAGVGYLELTNAGDFAANVWNEIPVPRHAMVLMVIGGAIALVMSLVALRDFWLCWQNVRLLRDEREGLQRKLEEIQQQQQQQGEQKNGEMVRLLHSRFGVSFREIGTEVVDRLVMDALLGAGSVLVGVGTLMAIWGADRAIFNASNLLSGYVGNSLAAMFGVVNFLWSGYGFVRFHRHDTATAREPSVAAFRKRLHLRFRRIKCHAIINGITGLVAGAASMVTATRWWGYVVLIPCILSSILSNYFWRWKIGYDRPLWNASHPQASRTLLEELEYVTSIHNALVQSPVSSLPLTVANTDSFASILEFIVNNDMFDYFCEWIGRDKELCRRFFSSTANKTIVIITPQELKRLSRVDKDDEAHQLLVDKSRRFLHDIGVRIFRYREQYLLELVGYAVWRDGCGR